MGLSASGKLDAANYSYSRAVCLVKQVSASHHSVKEYRDGQLDITDLCMTKKIYNRKKYTQIMDKYSNNKISLCVCTCVLGVYMCVGKNNYYSISLEIEHLYVVLVIDHVNSVQ